MSESKKPIELWVHNSNIIDSPKRQYIEEYTKIVEANVYDKQQAVIDDLIARLKSARGYIFIYKKQTNSKAAEIELELINEAIAKAKQDLET